MNAQHHQDDFPESQTAIYRVALSLDSFLLNGIPIGTIHGDVHRGFLEKVAGNLLTELAMLEQYASQTLGAGQPEVRETLTMLRIKCQQLIDLVTDLRSFRSFSPEQLRSAVSRIPPLRGECVRLIQELECYFHIPKPFYQSRPDHSTTSVNAFLDNLERMFLEERSASEGKGKNIAPSVE